MKKLPYNLILVFALWVGIQACETLELDINQNPSELTPPLADPNLIFNFIQLTFNDQHLNLSDRSARVMRLTHHGNTYDTQAGTNAMNAPWDDTYEIVNNQDLLKALAEVGDLPVHLGMGQVLEAFAFINLVDYIGTAVYSEAANPDEYLNPGLDSGQDIYLAMLAQLDEAIVNLQAEGGLTPQDDLYFDGNISGWVALANTLKLKIYIQTRLLGDDWDGDGTSNTAVINALLGNLIDSSDKDFAFQYGSSEAGPDTRHPRFAANYTTGASNYMANEFMDILLNDKSEEDPRRPYYIYRQTLEDPTGTLLLCAGDPDYHICYLGDGYIGRDHGDNLGVPADTSLRTVYGAYPAGGAYDEGLGGAANETDNLGGAGIHPIILSSFTHFWLAEAALTMGVDGDVKTYLQTGIEHSFAKVSGFSDFSMDATHMSDYIDEVLANYDAAANDADRLKVIVKEFYIAAFGNGIEPYNNYRRTGFPDDLGGSVVVNTAFPRSYFIPESEINANDNPDVVQKESLTEQVFWDTNPPGFIN